ncbi:DUF4297 domain-containing protein [Sulfuricurvum sp.]|uniref:DUF4297 domain-containing protein n=1 Tax=Sulfuricurvum sp. TaxID=2025608 RepID=UPI00261664A8|nr:DUF4297 domain-containing protein [Sulfuricurvum sp.]MDD3597412.1 DUF4297 domain-containing protein [Sulfuricurvum sp.]
MTNNNPLYKVQREKAGSQTFSKYMYQYHWALYRLLQEHEQEHEYAVFMELHEDVVLSDSLESDQAEFEFYQVKTDKSPFSETKLLKLKNGSSVLGKLISSSNGEIGREKIKTMNLVATNGFSLSLKNPKMSLENISINDIGNSALQKIADAIYTELKSDSFPLNLHFIIPVLPEKSTQEAVIGYIASVVAKLYPRSFTQAEDIYRLLINELTRKGEVSFDYPLWDDLLEKKSLTSITVTNVMNQFTERKNDADIHRKLNEYLEELGIKTLTKHSWQKSFERYYLQRIGNKSIAQLDTIKQLSESIEKQLPSCNEEIEELLTLVMDELPEPFKKSFTEELDIKTAILCELILKE